MSSLTTKVERLFKGHASVRSHVLKLCLDKGYDLVIQCQGKQMTVPYKDLKSGTQFTRVKFKSKFNQKEYELIDFVFLDDNKKIIETQGSLF